MFEREDWKLFRNLDTLCQKAGVGRGNIPKLIVKELVDNALDVSSCKLELLSGNGFSVRDFGEGLDESLLKELCCINRPMITSKLLRLPTRGALGNGLRVVLGAIVSTNGKLFIETKGKKYQAIFQNDGSADIIIIGDSDVTVGTKFNVYLGDSIYTIKKSDLVWGENAILMARGTEHVCKTSPFWYTSEAFFELLNSYRGKLKSFLLFFEGMSPAKIKKGFVNLDTQATEISFEESENILTMLREYTKPVNVNKLGCVGDDGKLGEYAKKTGEFNVRSAKGIHNANIPFVVESWLSIQENYAQCVYVNKTPITGEYSAWYDKGKMVLFRLGLNIGVKLKPSQLVVSVITPYMPITSDGKAPDFSNMNQTIQDCLNTCKNKAKKTYTAETSSNAKNEREIIWNNLPHLIDEVSSGGRYRFSQRDLFYVVRPIIIDALGKEKVNYNYFCSVLTEYENECGMIKSLFRDPRGSLYHPHLGQEIPLGTLAVEEYKRPKWTFNKVIYSEKEGFNELLKDVRFPEKYDCALVSSKGFASRAIKDLFDLLGETDEEILFFCIHDADAAGTMIYETLVESTKSRAARKVKIINLGLNPDEALDMGLQVESLGKSKGKRAVAKYVDDLDREALSDTDYWNWNDWLQENRVELNAMTPERRLIWLEEKIQQYDNGKVIPDERVLLDNLTADVEALVKDEVKERILREVGYDTIVKMEIEKTRHKVIEQIGNLRDKVETELEWKRENHWTEPIRDIAKSIVKE